MKPIRCISEKARTRAVNSKKSKILGFEPNMIWLETQLKHDITIVVKSSKKIRTEPTTSTTSIKDR